MKPNLVLVLFAFVGFLASGMLGPVQSEDPDPEERIPNDPIEKTNLVTGIWYQVNLKSGGLLTYSATKVTDTYHVEIDTGDEAKKYERDQTGYKYSQWMIIPSDVAGLYYLANRGLPTAVTTTGDKSPCGKYVVLIKDKYDDKGYLPGGLYHADQQWSFKSPTDDKSDWYSIFNYRNQNGIMTKAKDEIAPGRNYVQICDSPGAEDKVKKNPDYLWQFTAAAKYSGELSGFKTTQVKDGNVQCTMKENVLRSSKYKNQFDQTRKIPLNDTYSVKNEASFTINQNLEKLDTIEVDYNLIPTTKDFKFGPMKTKKNQVFKSNAPTVYSFKYDDLTIEAGTCLKVSESYMSYENKNLKFTAQLTAKGEADRLTYGRKIEPRLRSVPGAAVRLYLENMAFNAPLKEVSDDDVTYSVHGTFKTLNVSSSKGFWQARKCDCST